MILEDLVLDFRKIDEEYMRAVSTISQAANAFIACSKTIESFKDKDDIEIVTFYLNSYVSNYKLSTLNKAIVYRMLNDKVFMYNVVNDLGKIINPVYDEAMDRGYANKLNKDSNI